MASRCNSAVQISALREFHSGLEGGATVLLLPCCFSRLASSWLTSSTGTAGPGFSRDPVFSNSKRGAGTRTLNRCCSVEGDRPTARALFSEAGLTAEGLRVVLHF